MKVVFMGSPDFAVPCLEAVVAAGHEVALVVTQPDKPAGRGGAMAAPAVKRAAERLGLPVIQPRSVRPPELAAELAATGAELAVVVAYGKILPPAVLAAFPRGCVNVHGSLLPAYRGAAPIQWAVIDGRETTGVTIMQLDAGMDTGPMLLTRAVPIGADETAGELFARLAPLGAATLVEALAGLAAGTVVATPQPAEGASHARMLTKDDGAIDFARPAAVVAAHVRGVDPWPGAVATLGGDVVKLAGARPRAVAPDVSAAVVPGTVIAIDDDGAHVACADGVVVIRELQLPGRKRLRARDLANGRRLAVGDLLARPVAS
ncbi:MAG: methionyl-tRNA formyltransferase [Myxococcales bacterium]|nr:methionyl-tRNA formyltransferase [Myxococcales bacterium]